MIFRLQTNTNELKEIRRDHIHLLYEKINSPYIYGVQNENNHAKAIMPFSGLPLNIPFSLKTVSGSSYPLPLLNEMNSEEENNFNHYKFLLKRKLLKLKIPKSAVGAK